MKQYFWVTTYEIVKNLTNGHHLKDPVSHLHTYQNIIQRSSKGFHDMVKFEGGCSYTTLEIGKEIILKVGKDTPLILL